MNLREASSQINYIWAQVARSKLFHGYRPVTVATTGILGLGAAGLQPFLVASPHTNPDDYILLWGGVAVLCMTVIFLELTLSYLQSDSPLERRLTREAVQQFLPCVVGGGIVTWVIADYQPECAGLLPGLWAICFGLGVFASLPFVTPSVIWVATYYLVAGGVALTCGQGNYELSPLLMGGTFGIGQLLLAGVLYSAEDHHDAET